MSTHVSSEQRVPRYHPLRAARMRLAGFPGFLVTLEEEHEDSPDCIG